MTTPERREAERLAKRADELEAEADRLSERASGMYDRFAGGQPLLVGHHSYRSAVRDRNRADSATRLSLDAYEAAKHARQAANKAKNIADLADIEASRTRPWTREDFRPGDIVMTYDNRAHGHTSRHVVKRANAKSLTMDGGGGGWDDPKRTYDRVLSRTRDGVTVTDPAAG